jgi:hypothetical protein
MWVDVAIGFGGVLLLGVIGFFVALREIRRDEARRRANHDTDTSSSSRA